MQNLEQGTESIWQPEQTEAWGRPQETNRRTIVMCCGELTLGYTIAKSTPMLFTAGIAELVKPVAMQRDSIAF